MHGGAGPAPTSGTAIEGRFPGHGYIFPLRPSPPPTHTPFDLTFKSSVAPPPPCNAPRRSTPSVVVPTAHRWVPVSCLPATTTQEVNYAFLSSGPAYSCDFASSSVTHTVPSLPPVALSFEPLPAIPVSKAQPVVPSVVVDPPTPPARVVTQPQVVLVKQSSRPNLTRVPLLGKVTVNTLSAWTQLMVGQQRNRRQSNWPWYLRAQPVRYSGTWIPPNLKLTVSSGRL